MTGGHVGVDDASGSVLRDDDVDGRRNGDGQGAVSRFPCGIDGSVVLAARVGAADVRSRVIVAERAGIVRTIHLVDVRSRLAALGRMLPAASVAQGHAGHDRNADPAVAFILTFSAAVAGCIRQAEIGVAFAARQFHAVDLSSQRHRRRRSATLPVQGRFLASGDFRRRHQRRGQVSQTLIRRRATHPRRVVLVTRLLPGVRLPAEPVLALEVRRFLVLFAQDHGGRGFGHGVHHVVRLLPVDIRRAVVVVNRSVSAGGGVAGRHFAVLHVAVETLRWRCRRRRARHGHSVQGPRLLRPLLLLIGS